MIAILDPDRPRRVTGISSGFAFALLSILIAAPLAAVDPFAVRVTTQTALQSRSHENKSTPPAAAGSQCQFDRETVGTQAFVGDNPRKIDIKLQRATRCVFADITGPVSISTDERRIIEVEPTGFARVREVTPDQDVELVIDRKNGAIKRVFTINGAAPPDDGGTERAWLARVLPEVLSEGAIDPEQRVMRLLKSNGLAATLDQIGSLQSPAARLAHFKALVAVNEWNAAELERIKATAARYLTRTSDLAAFNRSMAKKKEPVARKGSNDDIEMMEQVLRGFTSSYDLHMAMKSQLTGASREMLLMFARVSAQISDSNEKGTFLIAAVPHFLGRDSQLRNAWFAAASNVQSSYERRLVLEAVLNNAKGSEVLTAAILKATTGMSPGYDKTVVLTEVAKRGLITTTALRTAFLAEVNTITSTTDRRTIIEALRL